MGIKISRISISIIVWEWISYLLKQTDDLRDRWYQLYFMSHIAALGLRNSGQILGHA